MLKSYFVVVFIALQGFSFHNSEVNHVFPVTKKLKGVDPICADFFSPNGDGHNDTFVIKNLEDFPINKLFVFSRWGEIVYTAEPYKNDWNGEMNIEHPILGKKLPEGMYFFRFEYIVGDYLSQTNGKIILKR